METDRPGAPAEDGERWARLAGWVLKLAVVVYLLGLNATVFTHAGTAMGGVALMDWGVPHPRIAFWERAVSFSLLVLGATLLVWPTAIAALVLSLCIAAETFAAWSFGGFPFAEWVVFAQGLRYLVPLALAVYLLPRRWFPAGHWPVVLSMWILRVGLAMVFAVHGVEALLRHPHFIDLLIGTFGNLLGYRLTESAAVNLLRIIGVVDLLVAVGILLGRWRPLLAWLCFWSTITAASRITALGMGSYPEFLVRASHIAAPVAIWAMGEQLSRSKGHEGAGEAPPEGE